MTAALMLFVPASVRAHASVLTIDPANDELVATAPSAVTIRFNEPVALNGDNTRVLNDAADVVSSAATVSGSTLTIPLGAGLADGTYTISFSVISTDSHPINGVSVFHVGVRTSAGLSDAGGAEAGPAVRFGVVVLAGIGYLGALVAAGLVVLSVRSRELVPGDPALGALVERWERLALRAVVFAAVCLYASVPFRIARLGGGLDALRDNDLFVDQLTGPIGIAVAVTTIGLFGLGVVIERHGAVRAAVVPIVITFVGFALEGHTRGKSPRLLLIPSDVIHVAAAAVWIGGIVGLVLALRSDVTSAVAARIVARFSATAVVAVAAVTVTGVVLAWRILAPEFRGLYSTGWGLALLVKVGLVAVVVALGWYNRARLVASVDPADGQADGQAVAGVERPAAIDGRARLHRVVLVEMVVLVAVVVVTSVLVMRSPVLTAAATTPPRAEAVEVQLEPDGGTATVTIESPQVGPATIGVKVLDADGRAINPVAPPQVSLSFPELELGPLDVAMTAAAFGTYAGTSTLAYAGEWTLTVRVRPSAFASVVGEAVIVIGD